jgi:ABC-type spermidine/putrescine transport system permease subunit II
VQFHPGHERGEGGLADPFLSAAVTVSPQGSWTRLGSAGVVGVATVLGYSMLARGVERLSFVTTLKLGVEVTVLCIAIAALPAYLALRRRTGSMGARLLIGAAILSLLTPTIARSLSFSALFAYYGPLTTLLRGLHLWPEGRPLDSSHLAVVISLVTLYLPISLIVLAQGVRQLGRSPEIAATLGAGPWRRFSRIIVPGLGRPLFAAGLIVFSQTIGVIITPRILGSSDITLAVLIDELMKRSLDTAAAMHVAAAELVVAVPVAALAAAFLDVDVLKRLVPSKSTQHSLSSLAASLPISLLLLLPPAVLLLLSLARTPVLSLGALVHDGASLEWYAKVTGESAWRAIIVPSLLVWLTAALSSTLVALVLGQASLQRHQLRSILRWVALTLLFIPQNALGVVLFLLLAKLPHELVGLFPAWALGGLGQAVPAFALAYILLDGALQRVRASARVASTLGASWFKRARKVVLPQILPTLIGCLVATALISLDDVIFVRYLPLGELNTFSTELFARARFTSSPDLAAACVLLWLIVLAVGGVVPLLRARRRIVPATRQLLVGGTATRPLSGSQGLRP